MSEQEDDLFEERDEPQEPQEQDRSPPTEEVEEKQEEAPVFDFGKRKKPKKKKAVAQEAEEKEATPLNGSGEISKVVSELGVKKEEFYNYEFLARRIFGFINQTGETEKVKVKMKPPVVYREGTKKTIWVNFPEICRIMNRSPEHVLSFLLAEVGTTGSIDGSGRFVIKGRFQPKHIENILRRYIAEYVKCQTCKSPETVLKRENRLLFMVCGVCGSKRTVTPIKTGFQAQTRANRRAART